METQPADPLLDLLPTEQDLVGQLMEKDLTFETARQKLSFGNKPLIESVVEQWTIVKTPQEKAEEIFAALELPEKERPEKRRQSFHRLPHGWHKAIAAFVGLSFLFVLPLQAMQQVAKASQNKEEVAQNGQRALVSLSLGGADLQKSDYDLAAQDFTAAHARFSSAKAEVDHLSLALQAVLSTAPQTAAAFTSLNALLTVGDDLSQSAALFADALTDIKTSKTASPVTKLDLLSIYLKRMQPLLKNASRELQTVQVDRLPAEHQANVSLVAQTLPEVSRSVDEFLTFNQTLRLMLGAETPMRYLLLFQNNAELRPTGGFLGSYAEMTIDNGQIVNLQIPSGGTYDLQGSLDQFVAAPGPLQLINPRWEFQDGNWFPDFPASAKKLLWFYDHAGGPTVDGVLAVNATFVAQLLTLLGPIDMPDYNRTITGDTFLSETQTIIEAEREGADQKPKQFLADLAPKLLEKTTSADASTFLSLVERLGDGLAGRDVQLYFKDQTLEQAIADLGWSGALLEPADSDYFMLVDTNLGGGKTDLSIKEEVQLDVAVQTDGSVINTATITRRHQGEAGDPLTGVNNVDYQRLYLPSGSKLLSASGDFAPPAADLFETSSLPLTTDPDVESAETGMLVDPLSGTTESQELGKTVFGNWVQTRPGAISVTRYTYALPRTLWSQQTPQGIFGKILTALGFSKASSYQLLIQKQSGVLDRQTQVRLLLPDDADVLWSSDDALRQNGAIYDNRTDRYAAELFER